MKETKFTVKKKILASASMLAVSAIMLSSATYAWFTMNKEVSVEGLHLYARSEGGLVIGRNDVARADATDSEDSGMTSSTTMKLLPTSTSDATTWYHADAAAASAHTAKSGSLGAITLTTVAPSGNDVGYLYLDNAANKYVLYDTFTVYPDKNAASYTDLYITYCEASANADLSKSVRVAFVCGNNVVICAPERASNDTTNLTYAVGTTPTSVTALGTSGTKTSHLSLSATNTLFSGSVDTSGKLVKVYIFFEGEDNDHYTDNLNSNGREDIAIEFGFACTAVQAEP